MDTAAEIGSRIARARRSKSISQEELADAMGVRAGIVSRWETGKVLPPMKRLEQLADVLDRDVGYFTAGVSGAAPNNGDGELTDEIRALREELAELRALYEKALRPLPD
jgi:transcriptional regulator with XRE-family HTH domain